MRRRFEDQGTSFLVRHFEDFYLQLLNYKNKILNPPTSSIEAEAIAPSLISHHLKVTLESMAFEVQQKGGEYGGSFFQEAMFIMAALADEFFLNLTWEGRSYWEDHLLESSLFGTHDSGDLFFKNLENFLRTRDPLQHDLAEVYLLALGMGFQGKYRNREEEGPLKVYRHQLYLFIYHQEPSLDQNEERLFPEAYGFTLEEGKSTYFHDSRKWMIGFFLLFLLLFIISAAVWEKVTSQLKETINHIFTLST